MGDVNKCIVPGVCFLIAPSTPALHVQSSAVGLAVALCPCSTITSMLLCDSYAARAASESAAAALDLQSATHTPHGHHQLMLLLIAILNLRF